MFDDEVHKRAIKEFTSYLRTITTQKNIAFFSDLSREYVRQLEKGEKIPSVKVLCNMIEAAGLELHEGFKVYVNILQQQQVSIAADKKIGIHYIHKIQKDRAD